MKQIKEGIYWSARDLAGAAVIGNHHFILLVTSKDRLEELQLSPKLESGIHFCTLGGFKSDDDRLIFRMNDEHDVKSVLEYVNPDKHTSLLLPDLDLEIHKIAPPDGSEFEFMQKVAALARNYAVNTKASAPKYKLLDDNCAAWVNTLFAVAGVGEKDLEQHGEFFEIDVGKDLISKGHFAG